MNLSSSLSDRLLEIDNLTPVVMKENFTEMVMPFMVNIIFQHDKLEEFGIPWTDKKLA